MRVRDEETDIVGKPSIGQTIKKYMLPSEFQECLCWSRHTMSRPWAEMELSHSACFTSSKKNITVKRKDIKIYQHSTPHDLSWYLNLCDKLLPHKIEECLSKAFASLWERFSGNQDWNLMVSSPQIENKYSRKNWREYSELRLSFEDQGLLTRESGWSSGLRAGFPSRRPRFFSNAG